MIQDLASNKSGDYIEEDEDIESKEYTNSQNVYCGGPLIIYKQVKKLFKFRRGGSKQNNHFKKKNEK